MGEQHIHSIAGRDKTRDAADLANRHADRAHARQQRSDDKAMFTRTDDTILWDSLVAFHINFQIGPAQSRSRGWCFGDVVFAAFTSTKFLPREIGITQQCTRSQIMLRYQHLNGSGGPRAQEVADILVRGKGRFFLNISIAKEAAQGQ